MNRKPRVISLLFFIVFLGQSFLGKAQEFIELNANDISRLGIVFTTISEFDNEAGTSISGIVTNSPNSVSSLRSLYSGIVQQWNVNPGDVVSTGDVLALIYSEEVIALENNWNQNFSAQETARYELEKNITLYEQGIISQKRLQVAEESLKKIKFELKTTEAKLVRAGLSTTQIDNLRNDDKLGVYYLRASTDGTLTRRMGGVGIAVEGNTELASIQTNTKAWVVANIPSDLASSLEVGEELAVENSDQKLIVRIINSEVSVANQTIKIFAEFINDTNVFIGELLVILIPSGVKGVLVSSDAVVHNGNETEIFVKTENGVEVRTLRLVPNGINYIAESGLEVGEEIVHQGTAILKGMQLGLGGE